MNFQQTTFLLYCCSVVTHSLSNSQSALFTPCIRSYHSLVKKALNDFQPNFNPNSPWNTKSLPVYPQILHFHPVLPLVQLMAFLSSLTISSFPPPWVLCWLLPLPDHPAHISLLSCLRLSFRAIPMMRPSLTIQPKRALSPPSVTAFTIIWKQPVICLFIISLCPNSPNPWQPPPPEECSLLGRGDVACLIQFHGFSTDNRVWHTGDTKEKT